MLAKRKAFASYLLLDYLLLDIKPRWAATKCADSIIFVRRGSQFIYKMETF